MALGLATLPFSKPEIIHYSMPQLKRMLLVEFVIFGAVIVGMHYWMGVKKLGGIVGKTGKAFLGLLVFVLFVNSAYTDGAFSARFNEASFYCLDTPNRELCDAAIEELSKTPVSAIGQTAILKQISSAPPNVELQRILETVKNGPVR